MLILVFFGKLKGMLWESVRLEVRSVGVSSVLVLLT